ncbi:MAG: NAD(P)H-binding protein [Stackebrandtia sp.]
MIGVTGPTGGVGSVVVRHLLDAPGRPRVVALARRPEAIRPELNLSSRHADYDDPRSLVAALRGVFVSSDGRAETMQRHHRNVIAAAKTAGVDYIVYTSILDIARQSRFYYSPGHQETEALLSASGLDHCMARTSVFADFFTDTWLAPALEHGELALPLGEGAMSLVSRQDVGMGLAAAVTARKQGVLNLTGPRAVTAAQACRTAAAVTGRELRFRGLPEADYRALMAGQGDPQWLITAFTTMFQSVEAGAFALAAGDVEALTGEPPQSYADYLRHTSGLTRNGGIE